MIDIDDSPEENVRIHFDQVHEWVNLSKSKLENSLIVCTAGISRSVTFVLSYLIKFEKMSLKDAYAHVKWIWIFIQPNAGFMRQLEDYEKEL